MILDNDLVRIINLVRELKTLMFTFLSLLVVSVLSRQGLFVQPVRSFAKQQVEVWPMVEASHESPPEFASRPFPQQKSPDRYE